MAETEKENAPPPHKAEPDEESDPYYVSSDSDSEDDKPPPMINIGDRSSDLSNLKSSLAAGKSAPELEAEKAEKMAELAALKSDGRAKDIKKQLEEGKTEEVPPKEREQLTAIDKEAYSSFKDKFENMEETLEKQNAEKAKALHTDEIQGAGKQAHSKNKTKFEKKAQALEDALESLGPKEQIRIERSADGKRRVHKTFNEKEVEIPPECPICGKVPYPVEKLAAEKRHYHKDCFRCSTCKKLLGMTTYNSHSGALYCKVHLMAVLHPELAASLAQDADGDDDGQVDEEEGEDYVKASKPKRYDPTKVVQSGLKGELGLEELQAGAVAKAARSQWENSAKAANESGPRGPIDIGLEKGGVKDRMSRIAAGGADSESSEEEEIPAGADPNIVRASRKKRKEELNFEVGSLKNKWEAGKVETAEGGETDPDRIAELQSLKGVSVKQRFKERTGDEKGEDRASKLPEDLAEVNWHKGDQEHPVPAFLRFLRHRMISTNSEGSPPPSPSPRRLSGSSFFVNNATGSGYEPTPLAEEMEGLVSSEARERFQKGEAYADAAHPVEKTAQDDFSEFKKLGDFKDKFEKGADGGKVERAPIDVKCTDLTKFKAAFEKTAQDSKDTDDELTEEERSARRKMEIEGEFAKYKKIRRKNELKEQREREEAIEAGTLPPEAAEGILSAEEKLALADRKAIHKRFEDGSAFASDDPRARGGADVEAKVAGKARNKFRNLEAAGAAPLLPGQKTHGAGHARRDKESNDGADKPEAINKRQLTDSDSEEEEYEVASIMNKFRDIETGKRDERLSDLRKGPKPQRQITPPPDGYQAELESAAAARDPAILGGEEGQRPAAIKTDAKNLKAKFESGAALASGDQEAEEEKRQRLQAEFTKYKEEADAIKAAGGEPEPIPENLKAISEEEMAVAAAHAGKMKAKWEKIEKKEAKKAQKAAAHAKPKDSTK